jgi:hypothetical protein
MMSQVKAEDESGARVFRKSGGTSSGVLWFVGGIVALSGGLAGFALALVLHVDQFRVHFMSTLPILIGIGALAAAWTISRTPSEVSVGPKGLSIGRRGESQTYEWTEIGWSTIQPIPIMAQRRQLRIYDVGGRTIAKIGDAIQDFDAMADMIAQRISSKGDNTAKSIQIAKAKRMAVFVGVVGVVMLCVASAVAWNTRQNIRAARLLEDAAVPGEGQIEERFLAPNGVTCRLIYRATAPDGRSDTRNAEVEPLYWATLEGAKTVPIIYVPEDPSISRLAKGEVKEHDPFAEPMIGYGLSAAVGVISLICVAAAPLMWSGWDIDFDSKTGRISIKRYGTGR